MRKMSDKARRRYNEAKPIRDFLRSSVNRCEACGRRNCLLDVHEISRGIHRQKALDKLFALLLVCRDCHDEMGSAAKWPEARQLALLAESRLRDWDLESYLEMTNPRAPNRIGIDEVIEYLDSRSLKVEQVADRMGVNRRTVQTWIDAGHLPAVDVRPAGASRAMWRVLPEDLLKFAQERKRGAKPSQLDDHPSELGDL